MITLDDDVAQSRLSVVLPDDHALFREGLHALLTYHTELDVVAEGANVCRVADGS